MHLWPGPDWGWGNNNRHLLSLGATLVSRT